MIQINPDFYSGQDPRDKVKELSILAEQSTLELYQRLALISRSCSEELQMVVANPNFNQISIIEISVRAAAEQAILLSAQILFLEQKIKEIEALGDKTGMLTGIRSNLQILKKQNQDTLTNIENLKRVIDSLLERGDKT